MRESGLSLLDQTNGCWLLNNYTDIVGYADANWVLAPTRAALQNMVDTCVEYANDQNLTFSADVDPKKIKTKCIIFLKNPRINDPLELANTPLPFNDSAKHLGQFFSQYKEGHECEKNHGDPEEQ